MSNKRVHLIGWIAVVLLFVGTIFIRADHFDRDLGGRHEWITAHSLMTMEIWEQNGGPSAFGFTPVYSYPDRINFSRRPLGGVTDENDLHYYTSYPPFSFIFGYYSTQILGGTSVKNIRILGYLIHFSCGLLLFLILYELMSDRSKFNLAGLAAAAMYFYSTGFLWGHGFLFFADMLEQLLILALLYVITRFLKGRFQRTGLFYSLLFGLFFLACYTEWLGLLFAFLAGTTALIIYFLNKKRVFLISFLLIGLSSSMAVGTTVLQYSSIAGWDQLVEVSAKKYELRSGRASENPAMTFRINDEETFPILARQFNENYVTLQNLIGAFAILFVIFLFVPKFRKRMKDSRLPIILLSLLLLAIAAHYYLFYNFNALHGFSGMKTGLLLILITSIFVLYIHLSIPDRRFSWILGILITGFISYKMIGEVGRYQDYANDRYTEVAAPAKAIGELQDPERAIFANRPYHPINNYYSKRDWFRAMDTSTVFAFMGFFELDEADYFVLNGTKLAEKMECRKTAKGFEVVHRKVFTD